MATKASKTDNREPELWGKQNALRKKYLEIFDTLGPSPEANEAREEWRKASNAWRECIGAKKDEE